MKEFVLHEVKGHVTVNGVQSLWLALNIIFSALVQ